MDVTDVLRDRMQQPAGLQLDGHRVVLAHGALDRRSPVRAARDSWRTATKPRAPSMTISLGGSGADRPTERRPDSNRRTARAGPEAAGRQAEARSGASACRQGAGDDDAAGPARPTKSKTALQPVKQAPDEARGRTPTHGAEVVEGSAVAETGARGQGFGLSTGGAPGSGATLDVADFCCPEYIVQMIERIRSNWDRHAESTAVVVVRFTIERDGTITGAVGGEKQRRTTALDFAAQRAVVIARQLPPLPPQFPNRTLTVHLNFQYQR